MSLGLFLTTGVVGIGITVVILTNIRIRMGSNTQQQSDTLYTEQRAAKISLQEKSLNHILCNNGRLYRSTDYQTVAETFTSQEDSKEVERLWIKRAPNATDSIILQRFFEGRNQKPTLYIGLVYRYTDQDRERLKDMITEGFSLQVWQSVSDNLKPSGYTKCLERYLSLLSNEINKEQLDEYTEEEVAIISCGEDGVNHILTNKHRMYRGSIDVTNNDQTVVQVLTNQVEFDTIDTLWIKKAPKSFDSELLQKSFSGKINKPILLIGHIHKYTSRDRQGLKNLIRDGFEIRVWNKVSDNVKPKYTLCLHQYLELLKSEVPEREPTDYTEDNIAIISCGEDRVTHLLTNEGKMYRNSYELGQHAEVVLASTKDVDPNNITKIWIKNSPCSKCTKVLSELFINTVDKPVIYVGSIYEPDDHDDRKGLLLLLRQGFRIEVWKTMNTFLYGEKNDSSARYLCSLRVEVERKKYCTIL